MLYNWQQPEWPEFKYELSEVEELLYRYVEKEGHISGLITALPEGLRDQSLLDLMTAEAVKTFAIEGEFLSREDVLSSIRNNLGLNRVPEKIKDKRAEGVAKLMVDVRESFALPLTENMLFRWHQTMMEPYLNINTGQWRTGTEPMQIISGAIGREVVHFEAPPADQVPQQMKSFIQWFNHTGPGQERAIFHGPVRSGIAHVYFESIHPFEDGNGRIGRALSEKALSQGLSRPILLSLSQAIEAKRKDYYQALKVAQRSIEITPWIHYFLSTILKAQHQAESQISFTIKKSHFFDRFALRLNPRQEKVLNRMFEAGPEGFEGGMSAKKYMSIAKTSKATATRDLGDLVKMEALAVSGQGRSTRYQLVT